jgi:hypothetical protein
VRSGAFHPNVSALLTLKGSYLKAQGKRSAALGFDHANCFLNPERVTSPEWSKLIQPFQG